MSGSLPFIHITIPNAPSHPKLQPLTGTRRQSMVCPRCAERAPIDLGPEKLAVLTHVFKEGGVHGRDVALFLEEFELLDDCTF